MYIFAVRDMKAQIFLSPNVQRSVADAIRSWEIVANDDRGESMISRFPHDFRLYHLATFDPNTGHMVVLDDPADLGSAADFKKKPNSQIDLPIPEMRQ